MISGYVMNTFSILCFLHHTLPATVSIKKNVHFKMYKYSLSENTYQNEPMTAQYTKHILNSKLLNYNCTTQGRCNTKMKLQMCILINFLSVIHKIDGSSMKQYRYICFIMPKSQHTTYKDLYKLEKKRESTHPTTVIAKKL